MGSCVIEAPGDPDGVLVAAETGLRPFLVQIPPALPATMAGINQITMMALSTVVIASMSGGLGDGRGHARQARAG